MKQVRRMSSRLRIALLGDSRTADLADELEAHIQMQTDDNLRAGMPPEIARRAAALKFGNIESIKESCRDERTLPLLETFSSPAGSAAAADPAPAHRGDRSWPSPAV